MQQHQQKQKQLQQAQAQAQTPNSNYSISTLLISRRKSRTIKGTSCFYNLFSLSSLSIIVIFFVDYISHIVVWKKPEQTTKSITNSASTCAAHLCTAFVVSSIDYTSIVPSNKAHLSNTRKNNENIYNKYNFPVQKQLTSVLALASALESEETSTTHTTTLSSSSTMSDNATNVKVLGICGGIGSGKSTVCQILVNEFGCLAHIDADKVAHSVYAPGSEGVQAIVNQFGTNVLVKDDSDNDKLKVPYEIHRLSLGAIVFSNNDCMKQLEQIVWPRTKELIQQQIQQIKETYYYSEVLNTTTTSTENQQVRQTRPIIIVEAAMLLDANWYNDNDSILDGSWIVTVSEHVAIERLVHNRNLSTDEAKKRYTAQLHRRGIHNLNEERHTIKSITGVITNDNVSLDTVKQQLEVLLLNDSTIWYK